MKISVRLFLLALLCTWPFGAGLLASQEPPTLPGIEEILESYSGRIKRLKALAEAEPTETKADLEALAEALERELVFALQKYVAPNAHSDKGSQSAAVGERALPAESISARIVPIQAVRTTSAETSEEAANPQAAEKPPPLKLHSVSESGGVIVGTGILVNPKVRVEVFVDGEIREFSRLQFSSDGAFEVTIQPIEPGKVVTVKQNLDGAISEPSNPVIVPHLPPPPILQDAKEGDLEIRGRASDGTSRVIGYVDGAEVGKAEEDGIERGRFLIRLPAEKSPLKIGQEITAKQEFSGLISPPSAPALVESAAMDWGRARAHFSAGVEFSQEKDAFSQQDPFLQFELAKQWLSRSPLDSSEQERNLRVSLNTFFDTMLAAVPVSTAEDGSDIENNEGSLGQEEEKPFLLSEKAAVLRGGVFIPFHFTKTRWEYGNNRNAFFIAPLGKVGLHSVTGDIRTAEAERFGDDNLFNFWSWGVRLGHFNLGRSANEYVSPDLVSYLDITRGKFENFTLFLDRGDVDMDGNPLKVRERRTRWSFEGRLKIPEMPLHVGFSANAGDGPDDLRFVFGTRFDVGKLFGRLKTFE